MSGAPVAAVVAASQTPPSRWQRIQPAMLLAGVVLLISLALHVRDPHRSGSWGLCPWLAATGTYCPGCGSLRAVHDLTDGDLAAAVSSNALLVASLPLVAVAWVRAVWQGWRDTRRPWDPRLVRVAFAGLVLVAVVFGVVRNLPVGAALAP